MLRCLVSDLDGFVFAGQDAELVDDPGRHRGQLIKRLLETDGGRHLELCRARKIRPTPERGK